MKIKKLFKFKYFYQLIFIFNNQFMILLTITVKLLIILWVMYNIRNIS